MIDKFQEFVKVKYGIKLLPYQVEIAKSLLSMMDDNEKILVLHRRNGINSAVRMVEEFVEEMIK